MATIPVQIPAGVWAGQQLQVPIPQGYPSAGTMFSFTVPAGCQPGMTLQLPIPAAMPAAAMPAAVMPAAAMPAAAMPASAMPNGFAQQRLTFSETETTFLQASRILKATYGPTGTDQDRDFTSQISRAVDTNGFLMIHGSANDVIGFDPNPSVPKILAITFIGKYPQPAMPPSAVPAAAAAMPATGIPMGHIGKAIFNNIMQPAAAPAAQAVPAARPAAAAMPVARPAAAAIPAAAMPAAAMPAAAMPAAAMPAAHAVPAALPGRGRGMGMHAGKGRGHAGKGMGKGNEKGKGKGKGGLPAHHGRSHHGRGPAY